ncbi:ABC transporter, partial [Streptomyces sp. NPDC059837]
TPPPPPHQPPSDDAHAWQGPPRAGGARGGAGWGEATGDRAEPGGVVCVGLLATAVVAPLLLPDRWTLFPVPSDPRWDGAHETWAVVLVAAALAGAWSCVEPLRRWRPAAFAHR